MYGIVQICQFYIVIFWKALSKLFNLNHIDITFEKENTESNYIIHRVGGNSGKAVKLWFNI